MDKRQTKASLQAREIFQEILPHVQRGETFLKEYDTGENTTKIQDRIRYLLWEQGLTGMVTITAKQTKLFIGNKKVSREHRLITMVRKLAMHVEDERLYEEAMELVGTI